MCASLGAGAYTYRLVVLQFVAPVILMMLSAWTRATTSSPTYTDAANLASGSCTPRQAEPTMKRSHTGGARGHGRRDVAGRRGYFLRRGGLLLHGLRRREVADRRDGSIFIALCTSSPTYTGAANLSVWLAYTALG
jgi:hypothetical protein